MQTRYAINFPVSGGWIDFATLDAAKQAVKPEYHHEIVEFYPLPTKLELQRKARERAAAIRKANGKGN